MSARIKRVDQASMQPKPKETGSTKELKTIPTRFFLPLNIAFYLTLISHISAALYAPIQDCDETFNYWEPLHYLTHGYGLETWEYSPEYSIRSWTYLLQYAVPIKAIGLLGKSKSFEFYFIRTLLAMTCAASETRLYSAICRSLNPRIGIFYLMIAAFTPGFFYASTALLPSSFAMYTSSLGLAAFLDKENHSSTARGIMWFAAGALLGWPFAGVLIVPFVVEDALSIAMSWNISSLIRPYSSGIVRCLAILIVQIAIDSVFYNRFVFVPWKIVSYNVFSGADRGPDIFGTEPWHFYVRNLILNFNIWALLAVAAGPQLFLHVALTRKRVTNKTSLQLTILLTPFYLWLAIFTLQPHKEERFMFPAYPFLAFNAAVGVHLILGWIGTPIQSASTSTSANAISARIKLILIVSPMILAINIGLLRILGTVTAYRAPLQTFEALSMNTHIINAHDQICISKEWYRFTTSFFLPNGSHAKFVKSSFDGLLPGEFPNAGTFTGIMKGTRTTPPNMNDRNEEDFSKYTSLDQCTYLVDSLLPSFTASLDEPNYINSGQWEKVACFPFLDAGSTHIIPRTIWVPDLPFVPKRLRRNWGTFCLLKRRV